jgi:hypothetical protein
MSIYFAVNRILCHVNKFVGELRVEWLTATNAKRIQMVHVICLQKHMKLVLGIE